MDSRGVLDHAGYRPGRPGIWGEKRRWQLAREDELHYLLFKLAPDHVGRMGTMPTPHMM
jgi:hypothetical protein